MYLIEDLYLGWQPLTHTVDCASPAWDVAELRYDTGARILPTGEQHHACPNETCGHADTFGRVQLRLLCRSCHTVYTMAAEGAGARCTTTSVTGWGQPPRQHGDLWLWPGQPATAQHQPHAYLVTRDPNPPTRASLYGIVTVYREAEGTQRWIAAAVPDDRGEHEVHSLRWRHRTAGLADVTGAADWIAAAGTDGSQRPLVVAVR
ncbi:hypothetical protein [Streptomyces sp. NPDC001508]|uniref:hypothetical protein n=1 Tax=Streptomyces sp. NPDC001508 TaxID=3154656 RepID=UPI003324E670